MRHYGSIFAPLCSLEQLRNGPISKPCPLWSDHVFLPSFKKGRHGGALPQRHGRDGGALGVPPGGQGQGGLCAGRFPRGRPDQLSRTDPRWRVRVLGALFGKAGDGCWDLLSPHFLFFKQKILGDFSYICGARMPRMQIQGHPWNSLWAGGPKAYGTCTAPACLWARASSLWEANGAKWKNECWIGAEEKGTVFILPLSGDLGHSAWPERRKLVIAEGESFSVPPSQVAAPTKDGGRTLPRNRQPPHPSEPFAAEGRPGENWAAGGLVQSGSSEGFTRWDPGWVWWYCRGLATPSLGICFLGCWQLHLVVGFWGSRAGNTAPWETWDCLRQDRVERFVPQTPTKRRLEQFKEVLEIHP